MSWPWNLSQSLKVNGRLQAGHVHVQDAARPDTTVLVRRLSAHLQRKSPTTVVQHVYICRATDQNSSGWQIVTVAGPQIWNSLPADLHLVDNYAPLKGIYVWVRLRRLVTLLFLGAVYKYTYLLTFLPFVGYGFLSVFYSNFVPILRYSTCNYTVTYLETRVRGHSRSSKMIPFNPAPMTSY